MALKFRALRAEEVECRVAQVTDKGVSILLYKDARCDQRILDETVTPMNWQRHHLRDNANCVVSIWDEDKKQWIEKEDTGVESREDGSGNEKKGLASDSFKRACFNWGIGRELYTSPFIWIPSDKCEIKNGKNGKPACYERFRVKSMTVKDGAITSLEIASKRGVVFSYGKAAPAEKKTDTAEDRAENEKMLENAGNIMIDENKVNALKKTIAKKGLSPNSIIQYYKKTCFEEMTVIDFIDAMNIIEKYPDKN